MYYNLIISGYINQNNKKPVPELFDLPCKNLYENDVQVLFQCLGVSYQPWSRLNLGAGVGHSGWLETPLPLPPHPETILTLSPFARPQ